MPAKKLKLPRGRIMYAQPRGQSVSTIVSDPSDFQLIWQNDSIPVAVIPCATVNQARAVVKMHAMTHTERFHAVRGALNKPAHIRVLSVLAALHLAENPTSFSP